MTPWYRTLAVDVIDWILRLTWMNDRSKAPFLQWYPFLFDFRRVSGLSPRSGPQHSDSYDVWPGEICQTLGEISSLHDVNISPKGAGMTTPTHKNTKKFEEFQDARRIVAIACCKIAELSPLSYDLTDKLVEPVPLGSQDGLSGFNVASTCITYMSQTFKRTCLQDM